MSKYKNRKVTFNNEQFDSKSELNRFHELRTLEKAGKIKNLKRQISFKLADKQKGEARGIYYKTDFIYEVNGVKVAEDVKGFLTPEYKLKRKLFKERYPDYEFSEIRNGKTTEFATFRWGK